MRHRTENEIRTWLKSRPWFKKYLTNLQENYEDQETILSFLNGEEKENTIASAFCWKETPEGSRYWGKREEGFLRWYYFRKKEFSGTKKISIKINL